MSNGDALLRAILLNPADDTARLVYADWLQENGQEQWAQFIRAARANWHYVYFLRNELARSIPTATFSGYGVEEGDSPDFGLPRWSFKFPERCAFGRAIWDRGFVSHLVVPLAAFMECAEALFRAHPIERVTLTAKEPWSNATNPPTHFGWWCENELMDFGSESDVLPLPLMLCMDGDTRRHDRVIASRFDSDRMHGVVLFEDCDTARDALSRACVAYGRERAGLSACRVNSDHAAQTE